jgi:GntR family transcriptional repressor for pyruvate dehydrogenase complex
LHLEPVGSEKRVDRVFEQLRSQILSGAIAAGSQLPNERDLAETLGVNRASVREALKRLEFLELVEVRHGQGTFVQDLSDSSALQVVEAILRDPAAVTRNLLEQLLLFRHHITLHVIDLAARNRSDEQLARAQALFEDELTSGRDPKRALEIDLRWNALLGEATGNLMYQLVTNLFTKLVARLGPLYYNEERDHERSTENHRAMLAAIEQRDAASAVRLVEEMLRYSEERILYEVERLEAAGVIGPAARARRDDPAPARRDDPAPARRDDQAGSRRP